MKKIRVGVVRGGPSSEYEVSLKSGSSVLSILREKFEDKYHPVDIFIDRNGYFHLDGIATELNDIVHRTDVIFNALHGEYGEDGKIQTFFETHGIPFTGSGSLASAVGMNKTLSKKAFKSHNIKTPVGQEISRKDIETDVDKVVRGLFESFHLPAVVKPTNGGSSVGTYIVKEYIDLKSALQDAAKYSDSVLIEEFVPGVEATCGVIDNFRNSRFYALPPIEIVSEKEFFDFEAKYAGKSQEIVPARFSLETKIEIEEIAKKIHESMGLRHYSRSDFIIHPKKGIYALEVNTLPGLTNESLLPKALNAVGSNLPEFIDHVIQLALLNKK